MTLSKAEAERFLSKLKEGTLITEHTFAELDVDDYLAEREDDEFSGQWMQAFERVQGSGTEAEAEDIRSGREMAYKQVFSLTGDPDLAGYVSDDIGLICTALAGDEVHDGFVHTLQESYLSGRLPLR